MWDMFPDDMALDGNVDLALTNMDLNNPVLEPVIFYDEPLEGSSSTPAYVNIELDIVDDEEEEEDGRNKRVNNDDFDDANMEDY